MKKSAVTLFLTALFIVAFTITANAATSATFSSVWFQNADGSWSVRNSDGSVLKNAWFCDDAIPANGKDIWYLIDKDGKMMSAGLVQDGTGNYYSLEMEHNGFYGMLRYKSGAYEGVNLQLESQHNGSFAAIRNADGIEALKAKYGVTKLAIDNSNVVYSSTIVSGTQKQNVRGGTVSAGTDWESIKDALINVGSNYTGIPNIQSVREAGNTLYLLYSKDFGATAVKAIYDPSGASYFMRVTLNSEWSDMANNFLYNDSNIPYYEALEPLYEDVLVTLLGSSDGEEFFQYMKANADQMEQGGYFADIDQPVWQDRPYGDGLNADRLNFSNWTNRIAENGLQYSIKNKYDGLEILFYKN